MGNRSWVSSAPGAQLFFDWHRYFPPGQPAEECDDARLAPVPGHFPRIGPPAGPGIELVVPPDSAPIGQGYRPEPAQHAFGGMLVFSVPVTADRSCRKKPHPAAPLSRPVWNSVELRTHSLGGRCQGWLRVYVNQAVHLARCPAVTAALDTASDGYHKPAAVWWGTLHLPRSRRQGRGGHRQTPRAPGPPARSGARSFRAPSRGRVDGYGLVSRSCICSRIESAMALMNFLMILSSPALSWSSRALVRCPRDPKKASPVAMPCFV